MAGLASIQVSGNVSGLGLSVLRLDNNFSGVVPTKVEQGYRVLAVADTAEALNLGGVSTVKGIVIRAVDLGLDVDTSYVSSFSAEIAIPAGESAYFRPSGAVYVKNTTAAQTPAYEYIVYGI